MTPGKPYCLMSQHLVMCGILMFIPLHTQPTIEFVYGFRLLYIITDDPFSTSHTKDSAIVPLPQPLTCLSYFFRYCLLDDAHIAIYTSQILPTRRCPHCNIYFAGTAVLDLRIRNVRGPQASRAEDLPSRGNLGTLTAARRYDDDEDENSEPPPTHDQPSRTIVDPNYWDNTYPLPSLSMESMMSSFAIEPVNGRNIGPSQRVGPGDPTVQPPREYMVVFEARGVHQRTQFASNTLFQAFLHRLEMESASVASSMSMNGHQNH